MKIIITSDKAHGAKTFSTMHDAFVLPSVKLRYAAGFSATSIFRNIFVRLFTQLYDMPFSTAKKQRSFQDAPLLLFQVQLR